MDASHVPTGFEDFDDPETYRKCEEHILKADALNFILEFDSDTAHIALDKDSKAMQELLHLESDPNKTRWISLWCPERQKETIEALADYYGFSPRLSGLMRQDPNKPVVVPLANHQSRRRDVINRFKFERQSFESQVADMEMTLATDSTATHAMGADINHYRLVDEIWYYCSVDWGTRCIDPDHIVRYPLTENRSLCRLQFDCPACSRAGRPGPAFTTYARQAPGKTTMDMVDHL